MRCAIAVLTFALPLVAQATGPRLTIERELALQTGTSRCESWSRDGRWRASGGERGDVLVVDANTGARRHEVLIGIEPVDTIAFAPDGASVAVIAGRTLVLVDVATGTTQAVAVQHVRAFAWSNDGEHFAAIGSENEIALHRADDRSRVQATPIPDPGRTPCLAFSPDDLRIAVASERGHGCVVSRVTGVVFHHLTALPDESLTRVDGDERTPPRLSWTKKDAAAAPAVPRVPAPLAHRTRPSFASITADGRWIALAADDEVPMAFDARSGAPLVLPATLRGVPTRFGNGSELALWHRAPGAEPWRMPVFRLCRWSLDAIAAGRAVLVAPVDVPDHVQARDGPWPRISADGRFVATDRSVFEIRDGAVSEWDVRHEANRVLAPPWDGSRAVAFVGREPGQPSRCTVQTLRREGELESTRTFDGEARAAEPSPDGSRIALLTASGLRLLDPSTLADVRTIDGSWSSVAWIDARRVLLVDERTRCAMLLDAENGAMIGSLQLPNPPRLLAVAHHLAVLGLHDRALIVRISP